MGTTSTANNRRRVFVEASNSNVGPRNKLLGQLWPRRQQQGWRIVWADGRRWVRAPAAYEKSWPVMSGYATKFGNSVLMVPNYYFCSDVQESKSV